MRWARIGSALCDDTGTLEYKLGRGAQPQVAGSGARLKKLIKNLATLNSPSTVLLLMYSDIRMIFGMQLTSPPLKVRVFRAFR
jgi:hypothetical protein